MSHVLNRSTIALTALAVAAGGALISAPAQAAPTQVVQVRPADLIAPTDTADGGVQEFLAQRPPEDDQRDRLRAWPFPGRHSPIAGDGRGLHVVRHHVQAGRQVLHRRRRRREGRRRAPGGERLRRSGRLAQPGRPGLPRLRLADNFFANAAPCTGAVAAPGVMDPCGSSGASKHGTLANWATRLQAATARRRCSKRRLLALRRRGRRRPHPESPTARTSTSSPTRPRPR